MPKVTWDPAQYLRYADERSRPMHDLLARVPADAPRFVVDLGCGPGTLTRALSARWPAARVQGVDSSPEMIASAEPLAVPGRLEFTVGDLREWQPRAPVDVLVSNATLQWVPDHLPLLPGLVRTVAPGGWFAFQVPANFEEPTHVELRALCASDRWQARVGNLVRPRSYDPVEYLEVLTGAGCEVDVWQTTYFHVFPGPDAVLDWMKGTGLRPVLGALDGAEQDEFLGAYADALRRAYPRTSNGTVLPYRRTFLVAHVAG